MTDTTIKFIRHRKSVYVKLEDLNRLLDYIAEKRPNDPVVPALKQTLMEAYVLAE